MKNTPNISFIVINFNNVQPTLEFLESTRNLVDRSFEVIVVDNASTQDPTNEILSKYPETRVYRLNTNTGFTGGNNFGISKAKGDYIFIINNDTEVTPNLIEEVLRPFSENESIGVVSPKIKFYDQPNLIQYAGFKPINRFTGRTGAIGSREEDRGQYDQGRVTHGAHGAAMVIKKEVIEKVGVFHDDFFLYYEEWDWSTRIIKAGYKIYYQPTAVVYHKESISVGKHNPMKTYYHIRNRILYMKRNTKKIELSIFYLFLVLFVIPKSVLKYATSKQFEHLSSFMRGLIWHIKPNGEYKLN